MNLFLHGFLEMWCWWITFSFFSWWMQDSLEELSDDCRLWEAVLVQISGAARCLEEGESFLRLLLHCGKTHKTWGQEISACIKASKPVFFHLPITYSSWASLCCCPLSEFLAWFAHVHLYSFLLHIQSVNTSHQSHAATCLSNCKRSICRNPRLLSIFRVFFN